MGQRNWYLNQQRADGGEHPADAEVQARLAGDLEYQQVSAALRTATAAFEAHLGPGQRQAWSALYDVMLLRFDLRAIAHFNVGVDAGLRIGAAGEDQADAVAAVRSLSAALARAAERLR